MKKNILSSVILSCAFCTISFLGKAQTVWCPTGAHWHYSEGWMNSGGYSDFIYEKDTIVVNTNCKKISKVTYDVFFYAPGHVDTFFQNSIYTYSSNDTVYFYNYQSHQFFPQYYFNTQVGDSLLIPAPNPAVDSMILTIVDSVGMLSINGQNLRYYVFHLADTCSILNYAFTGKVAERIGMLYNSFVPDWSCGVDNPWEGFRCYQDSSFAQYPATANCTYLYLNVEEIKTVSFTLSPNPVSNSISISMDETMLGSYLTITDIAGREVLHSAVQIRNPQFDIRNLSPGLYFVTLENGKGKGTKKLVKQ